jgi:hypothetical protein
MAVEWKDVFSANVQRVGHDADTNTLMVRWKSGKVSRYKGVSAELAQDVANSWSVTTAINEQIKPNYDHSYE